MLMQIAWVTHSTDAFLLDLAVTVLKWGGLIHSFDFREVFVTGLGM